MKRQIKLVSTSPRIQVFDNILSDQHRAVLQLSHNDLIYGWKSNDKNPGDPGHWNKVIAGTARQDVDAQDLQHEVKFVTGDIFPVWQRVQMITGHRDMLRCYFNGYTYGTEGYVHKDASLPLISYSDKWVQETVLLYCGIDNEWNANWGGETVFFTNDLKEIVYSSMPHNNRALVFDAFTPHAARTVSRMFKGLRKILVFKTVRFNINEEECIEFIKNKFEDIEHSKSTFYSHLYNSYKILKDMQMSQDVCMAALFHSVYGTEYFKHTTPVTRIEVKHLLGEYAEDLVYEFCTLSNRTEAICKNTPKFNPVKHFHLACMEYANLLEQQPRMPIENFGKILNDLKLIINS